MKQKHTVLKFVLLMLASCAIGAAAGIAGLRGGDFLVGIGQAVGGFLQRNATWGLGLLLLVQLGWGGKLLLAARRAVSQCLATEEDDTLLDGADKRCDQGISMLSYCNVLAFTLMGLACAGMDKMNPPALGLALAGAGLFLLQMVSSLYLTSRFLLLTRTLYPEKQAHVLSTTFHKEWFASCDEAERQKIGHASYRALRAGQSACTVAWVVSALFGMMFGTGIFPILTVCAILFVLNASYLRGCRE